MGTSNTRTPVKSRKVWTSFTLTENHMLPMTGTFNGQTRNGATGGILNDRWFFRAFADTGGVGGRLACTCTFAMPDDYIAGTDIKIKGIWTSNVAAGSNVRWEFGLTRLNGQVLGNETYTEWKTTVEGSVGAGGVFHAIPTAELTFSGTNLNKNKIMNLVITRDSGNASDNLGATAYMQAVEVLYQRSETPVSGSGNNVQMTPLLHRTVFKSISYSPTILEADTSGTFFGIACTNSDLVTANGRWQGRHHSDGANYANQFNWIVPPDYKTGGAIKIIVHWMPDSSGTGDVRHWMGLCTDSINNVYGDASDTEFSYSVISMPATAYKVDTDEFVFSGINQNAVAIAPGDPITFIHVGNRTHGSDTYTGGFMTMGFTILYESETMGKL
jgi:plastocyanin